MKVLLSWLREFAPIEGDPVAIGEQMSDLGMAVEEMEMLGEGLDGIVVAKVLDLRPHPDADRIQIVEVDAGDGEALQVCCGAFNMSIGDLVPFATIGTVMPNGMEIARRKMRGEWSNGMLCSSMEIGLGDDHGGIMILDGNVDLGADLTSALGMTPDVLYDLEINPNRPDAMSVAGVARDLAARLKVPFTLEPPTLTETSSDASTMATVEILDPDLCGRFGARVLENISVGTSPPWMANRLRALGMRPINSIVDISNYVMLERGQPNHTFDLDKISGRHLRIRMAVEGEKITTLDGVERTLTAEDGVIADGDDKPVSIAGIMGGASTEISETTEAVLLEMAWWDPPRMARISRRLGLRSEASARFERGADPEVVESAMLRFAELAAESGATLAQGLIDVPGNLPKREVVRLRTARVNRLLGTDISVETMRSYLEPIGFGVTPAGDGGADTDVTVPSFRPDTETEIDVIEEVARHHGYSNIARSVPSGSKAGALSPAQRDRRTVRSVLVGYGADEAMPVPFLAPGDLDRAGLDDDGIRVANPLVAEESIMRTSLLPGLLKAVAYNQSHRNADVVLFETGHVYGPVPLGAPLPDEREHVGVIIDGRDAPAAVELWDLVATSLGVKGDQLVAAEIAGLHPTRAVQIKIGDALVGAAGEVDPGVLERFEIAGRVSWLEIDLTTLLALPHGDSVYEQISRQPSSDIDLAFVVSEDVPAAAVEATLAAAGGDLLSSLALFDTYRGDSVGEGARSLAYNLRFQAPDRTLTEADIAQARERCITAVEETHKATLRS